MTDFARQLIGLSILPFYLAVTLLIGWASRRRLSGSNDFLNASRTLPLWVVAGSFLSSNCGALEIVGLSAVAAQYGVLAFHFYWIGAIPGMVFLGGVMIPIYLRSGVKSLPEYLQQRFDARVRLLNAWLVLCTVTALSGINIFAMADVLSVVLRWPFTFSACLSAGVVLVYVSIGGLRATIYNELLQLVIIAAGLLPLLFISKIPLFGMQDESASRWHLWKGLPLASAHGSMDAVGVVIGLGLVLSFSYWCTDFVQIQRALTATSVSSARLVPLLAGFGKLGFSLLVVVPALGAAAALGPHAFTGYNQTLPALMKHAYGPILLGLGMTALLASLMSGLAANVSAFSAIWTQEIYRPYLRKGLSEAHYIFVGRIAISVAVVLSVATSYLTANFRDMMEYVQLVFSLFGAPFFAIFFLGAFTRRTTSRGAIAGLCSGVAVAVAYHALAFAGMFHDQSQMGANFHVAIYAFATAIAVSLLASRPDERIPAPKLEKLVYLPRHRSGDPPLSRTWWILACTLLGLCGVLNFLWR